MGSPEEDRAELAPRLVAARAASDQAFQKLEGLQALEPDPRRVEALAAMLGPARAALTRGRAEVDRVADLPFEARGEAKIEGAVRSMFAVVPMLRRPLYELSSDAEAPFPATGNLLEGARNCAELREYAGQLGSQFAGVLRAGRALDPARTLDILHLQGRCVELRDQLAFRVAFAGGEGPLRQAHQRMEQAFFGEGVGLIDALFQAGTSRRAYPVGPAELIDRYVPTMDSIAGLRAAFLAEAQARARRIHAERRQTLGLAALGGAGALLLLVGLAVTVNLRIVAPLGRARMQLTRMAEGDLDGPLPAHAPRDEMGEVFAAMEVLRQRAQERRALAQERNELLELLNRQVRLDFLTNLPNRRGFEEGARNLLALGRRHGTATALALLDVDFFKKVNDTYGHGAGDQILKEVGATCRRACREGDVVARFGGEEFAILMPYCDATGALGRAEQIRKAVEAASVELEDGRSVRVTASLGVAEVGPDEEGMDVAFSRADEALYRAKAKGRNRVCGFGQ
jgi:diguanylate cyclase (GGDEF)-like protein